MLFLVVFSMNGDCVVTLRLSLVSSTAADAFLQSVRFEAMRMFPVNIGVLLLPAFIEALPSSS